jgi:hypothetical protein
MATMLQKSYQRGGQSTKGVFGRPAQPTKFHPNRDICKTSCLLDRLCPPGHCPPRTENVSQPCPVEKLDSSFADGQGWTRPKPRPTPTLRTPRWQGSLTRTLIPPLPNQISLLSLSLSTAASRCTAAARGRRRRPWSPPEHRRRPR